MLRRPDASRTIGINALIGVVIAGLAAALIAATGSWAQWSALGLGAYCVASWVQNIALRDPATFAMVPKCRTLAFTNLGTAFYIFVIAGIGGWIVPFMSLSEPKRLPVLQGINLPASNFGRVCLPLISANEGH